MISAVIILAAINVAMAWWHSKLIAAQKKIKHGLWGLFYIACAVALARLHNSWLLLVDALFIRKVVFDLSLNLFRGKPLFYVSATTTSIIDRWHNKVFGNRSEVYMSIYAGVIIVITILL